MKNTVLTLMAVAGLAMMGCNDDPEPDPTGSLELNFKLLYEDADPLVMLDDRYYGDSLYIGVTRTNFFLSNIFLGDTELSEIEQVDFTDVNATLSGAEDGVTLRFDDIPAGSYSKVSFGIGVSSEMNSMAPADFDDDHPLSQSGDYWEPWESYIFAKYEGIADLDEDGQRETGLVFHTGGDQAYRGIQWQDDIEIEDDGVTEVNFGVRWKELFREEEDEYLDFNEVQGTGHGAGEGEELMDMIGDNYTRVFVVFE